MIPLNWRWRNFNLDLACSGMETLPQPWNGWSGDTMRWPGWAPGSGRCAAWLTCVLPTANWMTCLLCANKPRSCWTWPCHRRIHLSRHRPGQPGLAGMAGRRCCEGRAAYAKLPIEVGKSGGNVFHGLADWVLLAIATTQRDLRRAEACARALLDPDPTFQPVSEPMAGLLGQALSACQAGGGRSGFLLLRPGVARSQGRQRAVNLV